MCGLSVFLAPWLIAGPRSSCTKPGGYVELAELGCKIFSDDNTLTEESGFRKYLAYLDDAMRRVGRPNATAEILTDRLRSAGFEDVQVVSHKQPFGPWPKDGQLKNIGAMTLMMAETGIFEAYGTASLLHRVRSLRAFKETGRLTVARNGAVHPDPRVYRRRGGQSVSRGRRRPQE